MNSLFQFSYFHAFYKPNNITTKLSLKVESYFQSKPKKETDRYSTLEPHGALTMKQGWKKLIKGVTPLLQHFEMNLMPILFCYIS